MASLAAGYQGARSLVFLVEAFHVPEEDLVGDEINFPVTLEGRHAYPVLISVHNPEVSVEAEAASNLLAAVGSRLQEHLELLERKSIRFLEV